MDMDRLRALPCRKGILTLMATEISDEEEFTRDWDWYAVDECGAIGHFTTAGFRRLPLAIKSDFEAAERCSKYFFDEAAVTTAYSVSGDLVNEVGNFKDDKERQHYLRSFVQMAERGLFSFDTKPLIAVPGRYYLVASPENPLHINELPSDIAGLVCRVRASRPFSVEAKVPESETLTW
jgi:hypothetical protein